MRVMVKRFVANQNEFVLIRNRTVMVDLSTITRVVANINGTDYDSDVVPQYFDWTSSFLYQERVTTNYIGVQFGLIGLSLGTFLNCSMVVYFSSNPIGVAVFSNATFVVEDL